MTEAERDAEQAQRLLDNKVLIRAFEELEAQALEQSLKAYTDKRRRYAIERIRVIRDVRQHLTAIVDGGKQAARQAPKIV